MVPEHLQGENNGSFSSFSSPRHIRHRGNPLPLPSVVTYWTTKALLISVSLGCITTVRGSEILFFLGVLFYFGSGF